MKTSSTQVNQLLDQENYLDAIFELSKLIVDPKATFNQVSEYFSVIQSIIRSKLNVSDDSKKIVKHFQKINTHEYFSAIEICVLSVMLDPSFPHESVAEIEESVVKRIESFMEKNSSNDTVYALGYLLLSNAFLSLDDVAQEDDEDSDNDEEKDDDDDEEMGAKRQKLEKKSEEEKSDNEDDEEEEEQEETVDEEYNMSGAETGDEKTETTYADEVTLSHYQEQADRTLDTGISKYPDFSLFYRNKASLYNITDFNNDVALENILKAKEICEEPSVYYTEGMIRQDLNMHKEAIELFNKCLEQEPNDPYTFYNIAQSYERLSEVDQAMSYYEKAIQFKSDLASAYAGRARQYLAKNNVDLALADYKKALKLDEENAEILFERAIMYRDVVKDQKLALADFEAAQEMDPDNEAMQLGLISQEKLMMCNKEIEESEENDWHAYFARGQLYLELMSKPALAMEDFNRAVGMPSGDKQAIIFLNMGYASIELGEFEAAKQNFQKAIATDTTEGQVYATKGKNALEEMQAVLDEQSA